jgi:hypothetical protein
VTVMRLAGFMPLHDGERQFLPVFYCVAGLAAVGLARLLTWLRRGSARPWLRRGLAFVVLVGALAEPAVETFRYAGHGLSYYNWLIGGLPGAAGQGMEISYWWEGISHEQWRMLLADLPENSRLFLHPDHPGLEYLKRWGIWRDDLQSVGPRQADYFLLYAKRAAYVAPRTEPGPLPPTDLWTLMEQGQAEKEIQFEGIRLVALIRRR